MGTISTVKTLIFDRSTLFDQFLNKPWKKEKLPLFEDKEITDTQLILNSKEYAPCRAYRRNVTIYTLVCYYNNITGCYLSRNADPIPAFIRRARKHMKEFPPGEDLENYYIVISNYLNKVESHLLEYGINDSS